MDESGDQNTKIDGDNNSVTNVEQSASENQVILPKEIYRENLENAVRVKELEMQATHGKEREIFQAQIDKLNNDLANLPQAFEELQKRNAELEVLLKHGDNKVVEKKIDRAMDAITERNFTKADNILTEIEDTERLDKKNFGSIAYARGYIAEQDIRWKDALEHYTRAAQLNPCFKTLIGAQRLSYSIGDYNSALSLAQKAMKAAIKEHGEDSEQYARSISNLAMVHMEQKKYELAEPLHKEALKIRENIFGKKSPEAAESLNNLGGIYEEQKEHREATYFFKRALNIFKVSLGIKCSSTAYTLNNLGSAYMALGEFKKAKPLLKQSLKIRKEVLGDNHPEIANSYNGLGTLYSAQGQDKKAEPYYWQALKIVETTLGHDHPHTILVKKNYEDNKKDLANAEKTRNPINPIT